MCWTKGLTCLALMSTVLSTAIFEEVDPPNFSELGNKVGKLVNFCLSKQKVVDGGQCWLQFSPCRLGPALVLPTPPWPGRSREDQGWGLTLCQPRPQPPYWGEERLGPQDPSAACQHVFLPGLGIVKDYVPSQLGPRCYFRSI